MKIPRPDLNRLKNMDRKKALPVAGAVLLLVLFIMAGVRAGSAGKRLEAARAAEAEFQAVSAEYAALKAEVDELERRAALGPSEGVIKAVDDVFGSMGLKPKLASVKPLGTAEEAGIVRESAELVIKKADLNEAVNILYKIGHAPMMLTIKQAGMRAAFSEPALDMELVVSLARKK